MMEQIAIKVLYETIIKNADSNRRRLYSILYLPSETPLVMVKYETSLKMSSTHDSSFLSIEKSSREVYFDTACGILGRMRRKMGRNGDRCVVLLENDCPRQFNTAYGQKDDCDSETIWEWAFVTLIMKRVSTTPKKYNEWEKRVVSIPFYGASVC